MKAASGAGLLALIIVLAIGGKIVTRQLGAAARAPVTAVAVPSDSAVGAPLMSGTGSVKQQAISAQQRVKDDLARAAQQDAAAHAAAPD